MLDFFRFRACMQPIMGLRQKSGGIKAPDNLLSEIHLKPQHPARGKLRGHVRHLANSEKTPDEEWQLHKGQREIQHHTGPVLVEQGLRFLPVALRFPWLG